MSQPLVSVVIPAHNAGRYIVETVESVLHQTYPRWELIVVNNGSTDDTLERLEPFRDRLRCISQPNRGRGGARNTGMSLASGHYIAFLDADDLWSEDKLAVQVAVGQQHPDSGLIACDGVQFEGATIRESHLVPETLVERLRHAPGGVISGNLYREFLAQNPLITLGQALIPRAVARSIGSMMTAEHEAEDYDYTLRIARRHPVTLHRDSLVRYRLHSASTSGPRHNRWLVYDVWNVKLLSRHLRECMGEERRLVEARRLSLVRKTARSLYYYGREHDAAFARRYLFHLFRAAPCRVTAASLAAAWVPPTVLRPFARLVRGARLPIC